MAIEALQNGRYQRIRLLGTGGMGEVYLMNDVRVKRQVAIKVMRSESGTFSDPEKTEDTNRLFQREARAIAALEHPNILPLYDFGEEVYDETTITYMVMPFCADGSLAGWLKQRSSVALLSPSIVTHFIEQAADALQYAHDLRIVHLDVKPSNFLLRSNKRNHNHPTLLLADFGIARSFTTVASSSHTIRGTPTSMAPEQWSGSPVAATDQYALAVMTYEMLAGRPPFIGSMEQLMYRHFTVPAAPPSAYNPKLPTTIDTVLLKALMKKPEERFPSITAFANAFEEAVQDLSTSAIAAIHLSSASPTPKALSDDQTEILNEPGLSQRVTIGKEPPTVRPESIEENETIRTPDHQEPSTSSALLLLGNASTPPLETPRFPSEEVSTPESSPAVKAQQRSEPVQVHNLPTVSVTLPNIQSPAQPLTTQKSPLLRVTTIILSVVLILVLALGALYYLNNSQRNNTQNNTSALNQTATAQAKITPTSILTPTPPPGLYIAHTYNGTIYDQTTNQGQLISIHIVQKQGEGAITGSVTFNSSPPYVLNGKVDLQGNFSFSVQQPSGQKPLYFYGNTLQQGDGVYLQGHYCSSSTNVCLADTGYFNVGPGF
jgi:serine/threonine protein kinase